jgi:hypothetical protein
MRFMKTPGLGIRDGADYSLKIGAQQLQFKSGYGRACRFSPRWFQHPENNW